MSLAVVTLKKGEGRLLKSGGMWVFDNEIASIMGSFVNGDIVLVHDFDGYPLGRGFINTNSKITVRLLSRDENQHIDEDFFKKSKRCLGIPQKGNRYFKLPPDLWRGRFPARSDS